ncbi:hypothetical protein B0H17DRAFT_1079208 [Mycena rosella]|uniref:Ubiquitin-like protease family profile domain-containing protein n=1 Tax=Mycena rosella TaxID=1033263 RepID=A0AAD7D3Q3_MYCRO|nr:hypothetical protein B0H17DRAFT_1079208 [Mycena rosella]
MNAASMDDRSSISQLHLHGLPPSNRDASQGTGSWRKAPTKIMPPSNNSTPRHATSNPYAGRIKDTLTNNSRGGNPAAQRNLVSFAGSNERHGQPPTKKAKHDDSPGDHLPPRSRKKVSQPQSSNGPRRKLGQPDDTGLIYVNDKYEEDLGQRVIDVDDLNIVPTQAGPSSRSSSASHPIPDGAHTKHIRDTMERPLLAPENDHLGFQEDSDDPIVSYDGEESNVKRIVDHYEQKTQDTHPRLDLTTVKNKMKPKHPLISAPLNLAAPKPIRPNKPPDKTKFLPIKAWYLGHKYFDEAYHLVWANGKITIRSGEAPGSPARHTEEVDVGMSAKAIWYVEPNEGYRDKVFVLETFELLKNKSKSAGTIKPIGTQFSQYFKHGATRGMGDIMIKFDSGSSSWADPTYKAFVDWLKPKVQERETLRGKAGDARWELANRLAQLADVRVSREGEGGTTSDRPKAIPSTTKPSAVPGLPPLKDWSPPPPPWATKVNGGPNTPIEIESPPRPVPRPTRRGPESASTGGGDLHPVRRSARQSVAPQMPYVDPDEVILVYPPGQTGAVNITNGDVTRLAPGEFLNDTLIEFGLKLWLQDLEKENPELVKQIHVFSSFFYKKLNKKNAQEGYESVRKWTSKFDLFDKKYIIIPINENLHWYLAIIYHPEHTLLPPPPKKSPATRRKVRQEAENSPELDQPRLSHREQSSRPPDSKASSVTRRSPSPLETHVNSNGGSDTLSPSSSNAQADAEEVYNMVSSCVITDEDPAPEVPDNADGGATDGDESLFGDRDMDVDMLDISQTPEAAQEQASPPTVPAVLAGRADDAGSHTASKGPAMPDPEIMDVDAQEDVADQSMDPMDLFKEDSPAPSAPIVSEAVKAVSFYGTAGKSRRKRKAESPPLETFPPQPQQEFSSGAYDDEADDVVADGPPRTYVFTLDSLGTRHPKVVNVLGQYLQFEAQEKKGIPMDMSSKPVGKMALVPHQPNFCDCGIYLLHLAETFVSDPLRYYNLITTKKGNTNSLERQSDWNDERTKGFRETLTQRIEQLSIEWKKERAVKKEEQKQDDVVADSSDDDIDIVETTPVVPAPPRKEKTPRATVGKATRMRG